MKTGLRKENVTLRLFQYEHFQIDNTLKAVTPLIKTNVWTIILIYQYHIPTYSLPISGIGTRLNPGPFTTKNLADKKKEILTLNLISY